MHGRVQVDFRTASALHRLVEITQYRPFYIMGDVMNPGRYPYSPGINVLQAVAIAGGFYALRPSDTGAQIDAIRAQESLDVFTTQERAALLRRARLVAEREGRSWLALPDELLSVQNEPSVQAVLAAERDLFAARRDGLTTDITLLQAQTTVYNKEVMALQDSVAATAEQQRLLGAELKDQQDMFEKGLAQRPRILELQRLIAGLKADASQTRAFLARAEQNIAKVQEDIARRRSSFMEDVEQQLVATETELIELARHRSATQDTIAAIERGYPLARSAELVEARKRFVIRRRTANEVAEIEATDTSPVMPDDVIEVPIIMIESPTGNEVPTAKPGSDTTTGVAPRISSGAM
jgi:polysaccharide export outer membrane protein/exopolysaccharide production protein ExoF